MKDTDSATSTTRYAASGSELTDDDLGKWVHLVGVYDAQRGQLRLYLDGVLQGSPVARSVTSWQASRPLTVGRGWYNGVPADWFTGGVDDVVVFQGALTDAGVAALHEAQAAPEEPLDEESLPPSQ